MTVFQQLTCLRMTPTDLKIILMKEGITQADIARDIGVKPSVVSCVVNGKERSKRVETAIAKLINKNRAEVWPLAILPKTKTLIN